MKGTCCRCKKNKAIIKYKGGVYCVECAPRLDKTEESLGMGIRYRTLRDGSREVRGKKGNLANRDKHRMRSNMGMSYTLAK